MINDRKISWQTESGKEGVNALSSRFLQKTRVVTHPRPSGLALILDWGQNPVLRYIGNVLEALGWETRRLQRGFDHIPSIVAEIETHRPALLINQQRLYPELAPILAAAGRCGTQQLVLDLGVWPHYETFLLDSRGDNASSAVLGGIRRLEEVMGGSPRLLHASAELAAMRRVLRERAETASRVRRRLGLDVSNDFSLLILQREGDAVLFHDAGEQWQDPAEVAAAAVAAAEATGRFVVIKPHPQSERSYPFAEIGTNHRLLRSGMPGADNDLALAWWMSRARNVITVNSTCHFQSLALGVPTSCLGRGWFTGNEVVLEADSMEEALRNRTRRDANTYLRHLLARQLRLDEFADPMEFSALMEWVLEGERVLSGVPGRKWWSGPVEAGAPRQSVRTPAVSAG